MPPAALLLLLGLAVAAEPADRPARFTPAAQSDRSSRPPPVELVVAGAITRGDYQAGQMWVIAEFLKNMKATGLVGDVTVVGSSAGAINSLIASVDLLHVAAGGPPEASLYFQAWVPLGLTTRVDSVDYHPAAYEPACQGTCAGGAPLVWGDAAWWTEDRKDQSRLRAREGLISHAHFDLFLQSLGTVGGGAGPFHTVRLGMTADRLVPTQDAWGLTRGTNEAFAFEVTRRGPRRLRLECPGATASTQATDWQETCTRSGLQLVEVEELIPFGDLAWHVKPSSGIPAAFPLWDMPCAVFEQASLYPVAVRIDANGVRHPVCNPNNQYAPDAPVTLVDGGLFNGNPVELADMITRGARDGFTSRLLLDPDARNPEALATAEPPGRMPPPTLAPRLLALADSFVATARLQAITEYRNRAGPTYHSDKTLVVDVRHEPISAYMGSFYGILDRSFRVWDYYLGVHDTLADLATSLDRRLEGALPILPTSQEQSALYRALHTVLESHPADPAALRATVEAAFAPIGVDDPSLALVTEAVDLGDAAGWVYLRGDNADRTARCADRDPEDPLSCRPRPYDRQVMLQNLETLTLVMGVRYFNLCETHPRASLCDGFDGQYDVRWFVHQISHNPVPGFRFTAWDLVGSGAAGNWSHAFDPQVQNRLGWLVEQANRRRFLGAPSFPVFSVTRTALLGTRSEASLYLGPPLVEHSLGTVGLGYDGYFDFSHRFLWAGGRYLWGFPPRLSEQVLDRGEPAADTVQAVDLRLGVAFPEHQGYMGPLDRPVTFEIDPFLRGGWIARPDLGDEDEEAPGRGFHPFLAGDNLFLNWGLEGRVRLYDTLSFSGCVLEPQRILMDDPPVVQILVSLTSPKVVHQTPPRARWPQPTRFPAPDGRFQVGLDLPGVPYGEYALDVGHDAGLFHPFLQFLGFSSHGRLVSRFLEGERLGYAGLAGGLRGYLPAGQVVDGEIPASWRAWYLEGSAGGAWTWATTADGSTPAGWGVPLRAAVGREWRFRTGNTAVMPLRLGLGMQTIVLTDPDAFEDLSQAPWRLRPNIRIALGGGWGE